MRYVGKRLLLMLPVFAAVVLLAFFLIRFAPGGPVQAMINPRMSGEERQRISEMLGLDKPMHQQFLAWAGQVVSGNLGYSFQYQRPVAKVLGERIGPTLLLTGTALIFGVFCGVIAGVLSALRKGGVIDRLLGFISLAAISLPSFLIGVLLLKLFALDMRLLPMFGMRDPSLQNAGFIPALFDVLRHLALPASVLSLAVFAGFFRHTRACVLETMGQDYIRTARAKGLGAGAVFFRHALGNALLPILTLIGLWIPALFSGAVVTETVFGWPGLGQLGVNAVLARDYPVLMAVVMATCLLTMAAMLAVDLLYAAADPRIRYY